MAFNPSTVLRDAGAKFETLVNALKMHDVETLSEKPVNEAMLALNSIIKLLQDNQPTGEEWVLRKRKVLGLIDPLTNSALLIALGSMRKPFEETLDQVKRAVREVDLNKIKPTELDPRGQSGSK